MTDGFISPSLADGAAAFPGPKGTTLLVRNHEFRVGHPDDLGPFGGTKRLWEKLDRRSIYDWRPDGTPCLGSVTTTVYDTKRRKTIGQHLSLAGTLTNCSGGPTPWGTWLSSEEVFLGPGEACSGRHGYTYEVAVSAEPGVTVPVPLKAMGRFVKEGAAVDPRTGIVYQTEDLVDGTLLPLPALVAGPARRGRPAPGPGRGRPARLRDEQLADADDRERPVVRSRLDRPRRARPRRGRPAAARPGEGRGGVRQRGGPSPSRRGDPFRLHERRPSGQGPDLALRAEPCRRDAPRGGRTGTARAPGPARRRARSSTIRTR